VRIAGRYFDGTSSRDRAATLEAAPGGEVVVIDVEGARLCVPIDGLEVSPRLARTTRIVSLPGGATFQCADSDEIERLVGHRAAAGRLVDGLERRWRVALGAVVVMAMATVLLFGVGVPWLADRVARKVPVEVEQLMGRQAMSILQYMGLEESRLPQSRQAELHALFEQLLDDPPHGRRYRLVLARFGGMVNALAVPGGTVIMTDELIEVLEEDALIAAIMAHELGHLDHRHSLRAAVRSASVFLVISMSLGDLSGVSAVSVSVPAVLLERSYSRNFEREADAHAVRLLRQRGYPPQAFARALERLAEQFSDLSGPASYLSTHPTTRERIESARRAADDL
jgi:Zn-dependent protease with chaperone function